MNTVITLPGWQVVGWTMLYFLAAGTAVALVGAGLRLALRGMNPTIRYATSLAVFAVLALLPLGILGIVSRGVPAPGQRGVPAPVQIRAFNLDPLPVPIELNPEFADSADEQALLPESGTGSSTEPLPAQPVQRRASIASLLTGTVEVLPWVWIMGTPLTFLLLASGLVGAERLRHSSQALDAGPFVETCETLRQALQVTRRVGIAVCERVATPLLVGIVRPLILLPPAALTGWSQAELEMVLLHELAHVRRWDNLVNLVQRVVESLLFFHPAVWIASRWVRRDREDCCDAVVVAVTAKPQAYAELLLSLTSSPPLVGLATSTPLSEHPVAGRIRRILKLEDEPMLVSRKTLVAVATGVLSLVLTVGLLAPRATDAEESQASRVVPDSEVQRKRSKEQLLYDGKTFEEWQTAWKTDLKTENRTECIKALAAFGRAGKEKEAAGEILDILGQYNARVYVDDTPKADLFDAVIDSLVSQHRSIDTEILLPILKERVRDQPKVYRRLAWRLLSRHYGAIDELFEMTRDSNSDIRRVALSVLATNLVIARDPRTIPTLREALKDPSSDVVHAALVSLRRRNVFNDGAAGYYGDTRALPYMPELIPLLFYDQQIIRQAARRVLHLASEEAAAQVVEALTKYLADESQPEKQLAAVQALSVLEETAAARSKETTLADFIANGEEQLAVAAAVALNYFHNVEYFQPVLDEKLAPGRTPVGTDLFAKRLAKELGIANVTDLKKNPAGRKMFEEFLDNYKAEQASRYPDNRWYASNWDLAW